MPKSRNKKRRARNDAAAPLFGRSRRLALESMESRLMLSGNQIDYSIWNLDSIQNNYAVISQGGTLSAESAATASDSVSPGTQLNVGWVQVPGLTLSPSDAAALAFRHYRDAVNQGVVNDQVSSALYEQWRAGFAYEPNATRVPVYALGFNQAGGGLGGLLHDSFGDFNSSSSVEYVFTSHVLPPLGPTSSFSVGGFTSLDSSGQTFVLTPPRPNDGFVSVVTFDALGILGEQVTSVPRRDSIGPTSDFAYRPFNREFLNLSTNFQSTLDVSLDTALAAPIADTVAFSNSLDQIGLEARGEAILVDGRIGPTHGATTIVHAIDAAFLIVNPKIEAVGADAVASQAAGTIIASVADALAATERNQVAPKTDLDVVIDQLVTGGAILVRSSDDTAEEITSLGAQIEIVSASGESPTHQENASAGDTAAEPVAELLAEGGMVPVEVLVATVANGSVEMSTSQDLLAGAGEASEVEGELARVAVMELIEGATEPMAPVSDGDHVALVATNDSADPSIVYALVEQAGSAIAWVMPLSPSHLAALVTTVSDAFASIVLGESSDAASQLSLANASTTDAARQAAFAAWDESSADKSLGNEDGDHSYSDAIPLVGALAVERLLSAQRRRKKSADARDPRLAGKQS